MLYLWPYELLVHEFRLWYSCCFQPVDAAGLTDRQMLESESIHVAGKWEFDVEIWKLINIECRFSRCSISSHMRLLYFFIYLHRLNILNF